MKKKTSENICPVRDTLNTIGGKWSFAIIYTLLEGTKRFNEIERAIKGINTRMLMRELKGLEKAGILSRKVHPTVPPAVAYTLTPKGNALKPVFTEIQKWATANDE